MPLTAILVRKNAETSGIPLDSLSKRLNHQHHVCNFCSHEAHRKSKRMVVVVGMRRRVVRMLSYHSSVVRFRCGPLGLVRHQQTAPLYCVCRSLTVSSNELPRVHVLDCSTRSPGCLDDSLYLIINDPRSANLGTAPQASEAVSSRGYALFPPLDN